MRLWSIGKRPATAPVGQYPSSAVTTAERPLDRFQPLLPLQRMMFENSSQFQRLHDGIGCSFLNNMAPRVELLNRLDVSQGIYFGKSSQHQQQPSTRRMNYKSEADPEMAADLELLYFIYFGVS